VVHYGFVQRELLAAGDATAVSGAHYEFVQRELLAAGDATAVLGAHYEFEQRESPAAGDATAVLGAHYEFVQRELLAAGDVTAVLGVHYEFEQRESPDVTAALVLNGKGERSVLVILFASALESQIAVWKSTITASRSWSEEMRFQSCFRLDRKGNEEKSRIE
jgi:hypothetical protein